MDLEGALIRGEFPIKSGSISNSAVACNLKRGPDLRRADYGSHGHARKAH